MFLKIVKKAGTQQIVTIYECKDIQIVMSENGYIFSLNRESKNENISVAVNGEYPRMIYIMNEFGKTVDSLPWKIGSKS